MKDLPEHYPAPSVPEAIPPTERVLEFLISERGPEPDLIFSLANVLLRKGRTVEALKYFRSALEVAPHSPRLRTNLGVALILLGEIDDAEQQFRAALLQEPDLELALLHLGTLLEGRHDFESALKILERYLQHKSSPKTAFLAGRCAAALGKIDLARKYYEAGAAGGIEEALGWLLADEANRAREICESGDLIECARILHKNYERAPGLFARDQRVQEVLRTLSKKISASGQIAETTKTLGTIPPAERPKFIYKNLVERFIQLGVIAEVFEEFDELEAAAARWRKALEATKNYPYGNYRRAIVTAFQGELLLSLDELDLCASKLPEKKQRMLKLRQVTESVTELKEAVELLPAQPA